MEGTPVTFNFFKFMVNKSVYLPLIALLLLTPWSASIDQQVSRLFFDQHQFLSHSFLDGVYHYGLIPAWITTFIALIIGLASLIYSPFKQWRKASLLLILTLALGSGLIIHALLKDHWGRPRPRQVIEFGGQQPFRAYYQPNFFHQPESSKSFPCGHCSMGFYFFAVALLGRHYQSKKIYYSGLILAWGLGGLLGFVRIAQGGHFLTDVLLSGLIMWLVALIIYTYLFNGSFKGELNERAFSKATTDAYFYTRLY